MPSTSASSPKLTFVEKAKLSAISHISGVQKIRSPFGGKIPEYGVECNKGITEHIKMVRLFLTFYSTFFFFSAYFASNIYWIDSNHRCNKKGNGASQGVMMLSVWELWFLKEIHFFINDNSKCFFCSILFSFIYLFKSPLFYISCNLSIYVSLFAYLYCFFLSSHFYLMLLS